MVRHKYKNSFEYFCIFNCLLIFCFENIKQNEERTNASKQSRNLEFHLKINLLEKFKYKKLHTIKM